MGAQELIEKAPDGRWQVKLEEPRSPPVREEPGPQQPSAAAEPEPQSVEPQPGAQSRWVKPLSCYERRETTVVEGLRYG